MKTIVDYYIISDHSTITLSNRVKTLIKMGWQPLGGVTHDLTQAMVRYEDWKDTEVFVNDPSWNTGSKNRSTVNDAMHKATCR